MTKGPRVLVVHSGARHEYALPAAFAEVNQLSAFYTDICAGRGLGRLANWSRRLPLPGRLGDLRNRLMLRAPPSGVLALTRTAGISALRQEVARRRYIRPAEKRKELERQFIENGKRMAHWGLGDATHLYTVFGEGGELVDKAREKGLPVLADIILALSTDRIDMDEYEAFPDWGPPPPSMIDIDETGNFHTRHLLSTTDVFVCPSMFVADDLVENWGVARESTRVVPYALREEWFDIVATPKSGRILFVGTAERRKGIHYLAKAANTLREQGCDYRIDVVGGLHESVRQHPESSALDFHGRVPRAQVRDFFAQADVFVFPSLAEGSATVVYEALAVGLPVITTHSAGSVVRHGIDGLIVPERDPMALAKAIKTVVEDRALRDSMSASARSYARKWNWQDYAASLRAVVQSA